MRRRFFVSGSSVALRGHVTVHRALFVCHYGMGGKGVGVRGVGVAGSVVFCTSVFVVLESSVPCLVGAYLYADNVFPQSRINFRIDTIACALSAYEVLVLIILNACDGVAFSDELGRY